MSDNTTTGCAACNGTGLVEARAGEYYLLEREMIARYGEGEWMVPMRKPCGSCDVALHNSLTSSSWRMLMTAWYTVRRRDQ